jgi:hypothetical protein
MTSFRAPTSAATAMFCVRAISATWLERSGNAHRSFDPEAGGVGTVVQRLGFGGGTAAPDANARRRYLS